MYKILHLMMPFLVLEQHVLTVSICCHFYNDSISKTIDVWRNVCHKPSSCRPYLMSNVFLPFFRWQASTKRTTNRVLVSAFPLSTDSALSVRAIWSELFSHSQTLIRQQTAKSRPQLSNCRYYFHHHLYWHFSIPSNFTT